MPVKVPCSLLCWSQGLLQQLAVGIKGNNRGPHVFQPPKALPDFRSLELAALAGCFPKPKRGSRPALLGSATWDEVIPRGGQPGTIPHLTPVTHPSALGCAGEQHWDAEESSKSQVCVSVSSKTHLQLWFRPQGLASVGMSALWLWLSFSLPFPIFCAWMVVLLLSSSFYREVGIQVKMQL